MDIKSVIICLLCPLWVQAQTDSSFIDIGYRYYELSNYEKAIGYFDKAVELDAFDAEAYYLRGVCQSQLQKNEAALIDYERALRLDSLYVEVYVEKGYALFMLGRLEKAVEAYDRAIDLEPDNAIAYVNRGSVKCIAGDVAGAEKDWKEATALGAAIPQQECKE